MRHQYAVTWAALVPRRGQHLSNAKSRPHHEEAHCLCSEKRHIFQTPVVVHVSSDYFTMPGAADGDGDNTPEYQGDGSGWMHIPNLHTCRHCDRIVITHRQLKHGLVSLPHTESEALEAEADGCPVFRMLDESWHFVARRQGPADLLEFFRLLPDPTNVGDFASLVGPTARFSKASAQNEAWSNKTRTLLWKTQFILDSLRRRPFHLLLSHERLYVLYGTTRILCNVQLKVLEGMNSLCRSLPNGCVD